MSGTFLYKAPAPHVCALPTSTTQLGTLWVCDCGQHYHFTVTFMSNGKWVAITAKKATKLLAKIKESS